MARQRILIVEDEPDIVKVLEFSLKQAGFEPVIAYDGEQARSRIQQQVPDLVLLDLMLPGVSGTETKPFSVRELMLRIKSVLRRRALEQPPAVRDRVGPIRVDVAAHRAYVAEQEVVLTALEFKLLVSLMARAGRVQSRERLLDEVWGLSPETRTRTVDTHVKRLREKLGQARDLLETVRGSGYRLVEPSVK